MSLYDDLIVAGIEDLDFHPYDGIVLRDDGDGQGEYIAKWTCEKPIPNGFKLGK